MAENSFDDEYLKCSTRMEVKYVPQLLKEERANDELLETVWSNAEILWNSRKAQISLPVNFKDPHGIALMAFLKEAQAQTPFYHEFNRDVTLTGQSRKDYIYNFPFKAFHFYLVRALQMLRRPCEDSYKEVVYLTHPDISTLEEQTQARLGNFTLAYSAKPTTASNEPVLTIYTCFGVDVGRFFEKERRGVVLIPLSEVFQVSSEGTGGNLLLQSMNSTCSYYECAYLGGKCLSHDPGFFLREKEWGAGPKKCMGGEEWGAGPVRCLGEKSGVQAQESSFKYHTLGPCLIHSSGVVLYVYFTTKIKRQRSTEMKRSPFCPAGFGNGQKHFWLSQLRKRWGCSWPGMAKQFFGPFQNKELSSLKCQPCWC
ncbi:Ecto-ADP-ribosyltransferase 3 [Lemmus lemmus]